MPPNPQGAASAPQEEETRERSFSSFLLPVLSAIGTGIGVLGFVVFFGGFILWARFKAAGLPANEAVAKVPRNELVATGASFLVPGALAALGLVAAAVAIWDLCIGSPRRHRREQAEGEGEKATEQLADLEEEQLQLESLVAGATGSERARISSRLAELTRNEIPARIRARREADERAKPERLELPERLLQIAIGLVPLVVVVGYLYFHNGGGDISAEYVAYLAAATVLTITTAIVVVSMTDHFAWYALCIFLGVGVMIASFNYVRTQTHPKISPVAALAGPSPVVGFFVAETSDAVYVGRPQPADPRVEADPMGFDQQRATLIRVPKDSVFNLTVGPLMDADKAWRRSLRLAMALCRRAQAADALAAKAAMAQRKKRRKGQGAPEGAVAPKPVPCHPYEVKLLANRLEDAPG